MSGDDGRVSRQDTPDEIALGRYLLTAAQSNIAGDNDVSPILDLIEQGCDLDLDVLPTIARRARLAAIMAA